MWNTVKELGNNNNNNNENARRKENTEYFGILEADIIKHVEMKEINITSGKRENNSKPIM